MHFRKRVCFLNPPVGSCRQQVEMRRSNRPSHLPELLTACLQSYAAELDPHLTGSDQTVPSKGLQV